MDCVQRKKQRVVCMAGADGKQSSPDIAVIVMRRTHPDLPRAFKAPLVPFLPALTVIFCLYLMLQLSGTAWISFGIWMVIGIAVYFLYSRKHSALNNSKKEEDVANL